MNFDDNKKYEVYCGHCGNVDFYGKGLIFRGKDGRGHSEFNHAHVYCQACKKLSFLKVREVKNG